MQTYADMPHFAGWRTKKMTGWLGSLWDSNDDARIISTIVNLASPRMDRLG